ncbi:fimbria/pilus chaperone family protein [Pandoraea sputorum]|uniref:P pilus assembly protein chaperone PapD-like protein n=1 Tax=Pandoraea sputorum TaxID=93222 RepID=A0A5E5APS1_9BURK|nr:fimbria/pilus chaperone family protein [Pandoraea sputorum]VVE75719.1 P pilus assembly protein chaperone PapD-like protein [Pandoraea sputorum]
MKRTAIPAVLLTALALSAPLSHATGVKPETAVVLVNEADGEGTMNVKNTDATPVMLYTKLQNIPEDSGAILVVTPPVARLDPGETQQVRFVLTTQAPLKTERLKRVYFEGIPSVDKAGAKSRVAVVVRQDLPVIIHPANLAPDREPWKRLSWTLENGQLVVRNDSAYVVRLAQEVRAMPANVSVALPKTYVLPGEVLKLGTGDDLRGATQIRLFPASVYGYSVPRYDAPIGHKAATSQAADAKSE